MGARVTPDKKPIRHGDLESIPKAREMLAPYGITFSISHDGRYTFHHQRDHWTITACPVNYWVRPKKHTAAPKVKFKHRWSLLDLAKRIVNGYKQQIHDQQLAKYGEPPVAEVDVEFNQFVRSI